MSNSRNYPTAYEKELRAAGQAITIIILTLISASALDEQNEPQDLQGVDLTSLLCYFVLFLMYQSVDVKFDRFDVAGFFWGRETWDDVAHNTTNRFLDHLMLKEDGGTIIIPRALFSGIDSIDPRYELPPFIYFPREECRRQLAKLPISEVLADRGLTKGAATRLWRMLPESKQHDDWLQERARKMESKKRATYEARLYTSLPPAAPSAESIATTQKAEFKKIVETAKASFKQIMVGLEKLQRSCYRGLGSWRKDDTGKDGSDLKFIKEKKQNLMDLYHQFESSEKHHRPVKTISVLLKEAQEVADHLSAKEKSFFELEANAKHFKPTPEQHKKSKKKNAALTVDSTAAVSDALVSAMAPAAPLASIAASRPVKKATPPAKAAVTGTRPSRAPRLDLHQDDEGQRQRRQAMITDVLDQLIFYYLKIKFNLQRFAMPSADEGTRRLNQWIQYLSLDQLYTRFINCFQKYRGLSCDRQLKIDSASLIAQRNSLVHTDWSKSNPTILAEQFEACVKTADLYVKDIPRSFCQMHNRWDVKRSAFDEKQRQTLAEAGIEITAKIESRGIPALDIKLGVDNPIRNAANYKEHTLRHLLYKADNSAEYSNNKIQILTFWLPLLNQILAHTKRHPRFAEYNNGTSDIMPLVSDCFEEFLALTRIVAICGELVNRHAPPRNSFLHQCVLFRNAASHDYKNGVKGVEQLFAFCQEAAAMRTIEDLERVTPQAAYHFRNGS
jgi:hypothetical protein